MGNWEEQLAGSSRAGDIPYDPQVQGGDRSGAEAHRAPAIRIPCVDGDKEGKGWSLELHDGKDAGAATLAARTRADTEVAKFQGKRTLFAFLDCSKCDESVGHIVAGDRAVGTGLRTTVANM